MSKMTRAQAKKRLKEAIAKVKVVYMMPTNQTGGISPVSTADMAAVEKVLNKCLKRLE